MQKIYKTLICLLTAGVIFSACSKEYMQGLNTDTSKVEVIDPNMQLTTALLQTYGDFSLMDTYRSYITGFTQHFAGGWNVTNYAGSVYAFDDQMRLLWDRMYSVSIKNLADAILQITKAEFIDGLSLGTTTNISTQLTNLASGFVEFSVFFF